MIKARTVISKNNRVVVFDSEASLEEGLNTGTFSPPWGIGTKGLKFVWAAESPAGEFISEEAQAVLDRMTGLTPTERQAIINFVNQEAADGNWALVDEFYSFGLAGANALVGFIAKTATNNGAVLSVDGATFAGAENIGSDIDASLLTNYSLDNAMVGVFVVQTLDSGSGGNFPYGARGAGNDRIEIQSALGQAVNAGQQNPFTETLRNNLLRLGTRVNNTQSSGNDNGVGAGLRTSTSVGIPTTPISIGALNNNGALGNYMNGKIA